MLKPQLPIGYPGLTKRLRRIPIEQFPKSLFIRPPGQDDIQLFCGSCQRFYEPPWTERLADEYAPVADAAGTVFSIGGFPIPCPACGTKHVLEFPRADNMASITFYGDEAEHSFSKKSHMYAYAFVAVTNDNFLSSLQTAMDRLKKAIRPGVAPQSWPFHTLDLRDPEWRKKHRVIQSLNEIDALLLTLCDALAADKESRAISVTLLPPATFQKAKPPLPLIQKQVLTAAVMGLTDMMTATGFSPSFVLEAQSRAHKDGSIDFFVEKIGRGLRYNLIFLYISRCCPVGLITTEPKHPPIL